MGHSKRQTNTVKIPLDLVIKPCFFFNVSAFSLLIPRQHRQRRERNTFGLFNSVSVEFADTCCAHHTTCFSTAVPVGGVGASVRLGQRNVSVFLKTADSSALISARVFKPTVMFLREYSGGDRLHLHSFEQQEVHFKECTSAARLFGYTFVKRNPFLAII